MDSRVEVADKLTAIITDLTGVSRLMMAVYEDALKNGLDAEHLVIKRVIMCNGISKTSIAVLPPCDMVPRP